MSILAPILGPTWLHFGSQNRSKSVKNRFSKGTPKMIDFYIVFGSILGRFWGPTWGHLGPGWAILAPNMVHFGPKLGLRGAAGAPDSSRRLPGGLPGAPRSSPGSILDRFWVDFRSILDRFGIDLGSSWIDLASIWDRFLTDLGPIWETIFLTVPPYTNLKPSFIINFIGNLN